MAVNLFHKVLFIVLLFCVTPLSFAFLTLPTGFVHLKYIDPSIIQDMRYATENNFVGKRITGYHKGECILTRETAFVLAKLQQDLNRHHLGIKVFDCYRPQRAADEFYAWSKDPTDQKMKEDYYPRINKENLFRLSYIAERSGHSRGSTVDLTIVSFKKGKNHPVELDMGTHFDYLDPASHPSSNQVGATAQHNRQQLKRIMSAAGFSPLRTEWWHFTLENESHPDTYYDFVVE